MEGLERVCVDFKAYFPLVGKVPFRRSNGVIEGGKALFKGGILAFIGEEETGKDVVEWIGASEAFDIRELERVLVFLAIKLG